MKALKFVTASALLMATVAVAPSYAQEAASQCSCISAGPDAGPVGSIVAARGEVLASGAANYEAAAVGTPVSIGTEISVGANSSARITVGTCRVQLTANTLTRVSALNNGNVCVASLEAGTLPVAPVAGPPPSWVPLGLFTAAATAATLLSLSNNGKDGASQPISQ